MGISKYFKISRPDPFKGSLFAQDEPQFIDWAEPPKHTQVDIKTFRQIKRDLKLKKGTNKQVALWYGIGQTTLYLIKRAPSYKQYKIIRRAHSKPQTYRSKKSGQNNSNIHTNAQQTKKHANRVDAK